MHPCRSARLPRTLVLFTLAAPLAALAFAACGSDESNGPGALGDAAPSEGSIGAPGPDVGADDTGAGDAGATSQDGAIITIARESRLTGSPASMAFNAGTHKAYFAVASV